MIGKKSVTYCKKKEKFLYYIETHKITDFSHAKTIKLDWSRKLKDCT